jgi:hypothetical protein
MTSTLTIAKDNLFSRPAEEHFENFAALRDSAAKQRQRCREIEARDHAILFGESGDVYFGDQAVRPTHYSFSQLAGVARVPMHVLERLELSTRASVMNQTFERSKRFRVGLCDGDNLRAVTSDRYERVFDEELLEAIDRWLLPSGFVPAVPTSGGANARGNTKPALYRSDRDLFAFFYSEKEVRPEVGGLRRGLMMWNSEVGAKSLGYATFVLRTVCSNHLVLGVGEYAEVRARHVSNVRDTFLELQQDLRKISNEMTSEEMRLVEEAIRADFTPQQDPEDAQDRLVEQFGLPRKVANAAVEAALIPENPGSLSVWGVANGVSWLAHETAFADERAELQRVAGKILLA